jgi:hypothetical protein
MARRPFVILLIFFLTLSVSCGSICTRLFYINKIFSRVSIQPVPQKRKKDKAIPYDSNAPA